MPAGQGNTKVVGRRCNSLISIPVSVITGFDDDHNGLMSPEELGRHHGEIEGQLEQRVRFFDDTAQGKTIYQALLVEHTDSAATNMSSFTLMRITEFARPVRQLRVRLDLFPALSGADSVLTFQAMRDNHTETRRFTAGKVEYTFFRFGDIGPWIFGALALAGALLLVHLNKRQAALTDALSP